MARNHSLWTTARPTLSEALLLRDDLSVDVCVVGAGIAGLLVAQRLLERGLTVAVLERQSLGSGETRQTTAHMTALLDTRYFVLEREHGAEAVRLVAASHVAAIEHVEALVQRLALDCEWSRVDGHLYAADEAANHDIEQELAALERVGVPAEDAGMLPPPFGFGRALRLPRQAQVHPMKLLAGLARYIELQGGRVFLQTHVDAIETGVPAIVHTQRGPQVRAKAVVIATNTPINARFAMHTKQAPYRTYALAASVPRGAIPPGLYWDTADPYHYVRLARATESGLPDEREWLIVGGEDHKVGQSEHPEASWGRLEQWLRERFPSAEPAAYRWSGQVLEPADGLGYIGPSPGSGNVFIVTGHSGNGTTYAGIAALLLSELIAGAQHPWASVYDPARKPLGRQGLTNFAHENLNVAKKYAEWLTPGSVDNIQQIPIGEGRVIRRGLKKIAVFVDSDGRAHERSAVCPHLGCVVQWNSAEKSWDCPCHGSRFDAYGHVQTGPARRDLDGANDPPRERVDPQHHHRH